MGSVATVPGSAPRAVHAQLADGRRLTAADISLSTGLPRSTVVHALKRLAEAGEVEQHAPGRRGRGRPSHTWSVVTPPGPVAVVVAGAHGTTLGVVSAEGRVLASVETDPLEEVTDGRAAAPALESLDRLLSEAQVTPADLSMAVIGLPGPSDFSSDAGSRTDNRGSSGHLRRFRTWDGQPPTALLGRHLGCRVYGENDANLAALGEALTGAGVGRSTVLGVGLAHGTGAGLVIDGRLHRGRSGLAGEIGHLHTDDHGRLCHCGARGCFWHTRSVPALLQALADAHGTSFSVEDVARGAAEDDHGVVRALLGFGDALGRRLADAVVFIDPDAIVIDGSLGAASHVIVDGVQDAIRRYAPPTMARGVEVLAGTLGTAAVLVGAAALARSEGLFVRRDPDRNRVGRANS